MPTFPHIQESLRRKRLSPPAELVSMVLDTDTFNEVDDQFALVYALVSPERLNVEAVYAAPFHNSRSSSPADGMEKSYQEILRLLGLIEPEIPPSVFKGSTAYLPSEQPPEKSPAVLDLVDRARTRPENQPLYVAAIGAITNVASAILLAPDIIEKIVVVWLGGHAFHWPDTREFNLRQDPDAARLIFKCGVPVVHIPCLGVASHLQTTLPELEQYVRPQGDLGEYLFETVANYSEDPFAWSKVLWDLAAIAYLIEPKWVPSGFVPSPIISDQLTWALDPTRHLIRSARFVQRDAVYRDLFSKLERFTAGKGAKPLA